MLEGKPGILDVAVFGGGLHVKVDDRGARDPADSSRCWSAPGFKCRSLEPIAPSMEDVFVSLIEKEEKAEQPHEFPPHPRDRAQGIAAHPARSAQPVRRAAAAAGDAADLRLRAEPGRGPHPDLRLRSWTDRRRAAI